MFFRRWLATLARSVFQPLSCKSYVFWGRMKAFLNQRLGGESAGQHPPRTGKLFCFVRACVGRERSGCIGKAGADERQPPFPFSLVGAVFRLLSSPLSLLSLCETMCEQVVGKPLNITNHKHLKQLSACCGQSCETSCERTYEQFVNTEWGTWSGCEHILNRP